MESKPFWSILFVKVLLNYNVLDDLDFFIAPNVLLDLQTAKHLLGSRAPDSNPPGGEEMYDFEMFLLG